MREALRAVVERGDLRDPTKLSELNELFGEEPRAEPRRAILAGSRFDWPLTRAPW